MNRINEIVKYTLLKNINSVNMNRKYSSSEGINENEYFNQILKNTLIKSIESSLSTDYCDSNSCRLSKRGINIYNTSNNFRVIEQSNSTITTTDKSNNDKSVSSEINYAMDLLEKQVGKPYVWGANGPDSFDCSGLTRYIYKEAFGKDIPRVSYDQSKFGMAVDKDNLQPGDLVFFDTMNKGKVSHVGIYIGNDEFIHASNAKDGVKKSKLSSSYYQRVYQGARRP